MSFILLASTPMCIWYPLKRTTDRVSYRDIIHENKQVKTWEFEDHTHNCRLVAVVFKVLKHELRPWKVLWDLNIGKLAFQPHCSDVSNTEVHSNKMAKRVLSLANYISQMSEGIYRGVFLLERDVMLPDCWILFYLFCCSWHNYAKWESNHCVHNRFILTPQQQENGR